MGTVSRARRRLAPPLFCDGPAQTRGCRKSARGGARNGLARTNVRRSPSSHGSPPRPRLQTLRSASPSARPWPCPPAARARSSRKPWPPPRPSWPRTPSRPASSPWPTACSTRSSRSGPADGPKPNLDRRGQGQLRGQAGRRARCSTAPTSAACPPRSCCRGLVPAWREALVMMRPGDEWTLYVPPNLGYGAQDKGPIPGNSVDDLPHRADRCSAHQDPGPEAAPAGLTSNLCSSAE